MAYNSALNRLSPKNKNGLNSIWDTGTSKNNENKGYPYNTQQKSNTSTASTSSKPKSAASQPIHIGTGTATAPKTGMGNPVANGFNNAASHVLGGNLSAYLPGITSPQSSSSAKKNTSSGNTTTGGISYTPSPKIPDTLKGREHSMKYYIFMILFIICISTIALMYPTDSDQEKIIKDFYENQDLFEKSVECLSPSTKDIHLTDSNEVFTGNEINQSLSFFVKECFDSNKVTVISKN